MNPETLSPWQVWAVLSAVFAALTAIFAKVGVEGIDSDLVTLIRTAIVLITLSLILFATGKLSNPGPISPKSWIFLVLSALGTGAFGDGTRRVIRSGVTRAQIAATPTERARTLSRDKGT